jgi:CheY-like chemotaxis protein
MTIEQNEPQAIEPRTSENQGAATQVPIPGQGRRRRRRRRNKSQGKPQPNGSATQGATPPGDAPAAQPAPARQAPPQLAQRQRSQGRQFKGNGGANGNGNGNGANGHYSNGNGQKQAAGGGRRKGKQQRRQQVFVGPMDHSYRMVNGNIADNGHQQNHNYEFRGMPHSGFYGEQDVFSMPAVAAPVREDAPVRIYFFIEDLFFVAKIQEASKKLGVKVEFAKADKDTLAKITGASEEERPSLIVFDLNNAGAKPLTVIPKLKAKLKRGTSIIGFLNHLQGDLKGKATEAGCDMVMPRSAFSQNLPNLLRRHGLDEELEAIEA